MEKLRPARPQPEDPAPREDVRVHANRCPFCHDDVQPKESVVCQDCLARHHPPCWAESAGCGTCRGTKLMARTLTVAEQWAADEREQRRRVATESPALRTALGVMFVGLLVVTLVLAGAFLWRSLPLIPQDGAVAVGGTLLGLFILLGAAFASWRSARIRLWDATDEGEGS